MITPREKTSLGGPARLESCLLGRHVGDRSLALSRLSESLVDGLAAVDVESLREPEVGDHGLEVARSLEEHVSGLEVAVDEASCMGSSHGGSQSAPQDKGALDVERSSRESL